MSGAIPFPSFEAALKAMPAWLYVGIDLVGQHKTIDDLAFMVQHEIDLYREGEENAMKCRTYLATTRRYRAAKNFLARCKAAHSE